jgi:hypothetical protein
MAYNEANGIEPVGIQKAIRDITDSLRKVAEEQTEYKTSGVVPKEELTRMVIALEKQMKQAAKSLEFEKAAGLRDQVIQIRKALVSDVDAVRELASVAGQDGVVPFSDKAALAAQRQQREVQYKPGRRGARYRR